MAIQGEPVAHNDLVSGAETTLHSHAGGGGYTPVLFYTKGNGTQSLSATSLTTVQLAVASISDAGYSFSSDQVTIQSALDGKRVRIDYMLGSTGAGNRQTLRCTLQINTGTVSEMQCYTTRNATHNNGGVCGFWYGTVNTNDVIRLQYSRVQTTGTQDADMTALGITTLD